MNILFGFMVLFMLSAVVNFSMTLKSKGPDVEAYAHALYVSLFGFGLSVVSILVGAVIS